MRLGGGSRFGSARPLKGVVSQQGIKLQDARVQASVTTEPDSKVTHDGVFTLRRVSGGHVVKFFGEGQGQL